MQPFFLPQQVAKAVHHLFEDLSTPLSLKASLLLRYGEYDQLASCYVDPRNYIDPERYRRDVASLSILRKLVTLPTTIDRKAVAEESFLACEASCLRTNSRLYPLLCPELDTGFPAGVLSHIARARKIIAEILGPCPDLVEGRFGPGATFGDKGRLTTIPDKMSSSPTLTPDALPFLFQWSSTLWASACAAKGREVSFVPGNRFSTVPKDCTKDRGIAIEPSINLFYQLGYGRVIRSRLKSARIDLANGQDIHRRVACEASIRGHLCTLDLSNASDTVSRNLVKLLLPRRWFQALDDLRSKKTLFRGRWHVLEKFSSMGNGFTFELETLIFLGLILGLTTAGHKLVAGSNVFVYGDDIICPTGCSEDVMSMLEFFGLTVNKRKSFVDGPFRESCGGDYFLGVDVRPYFLKESPDEPQQLISLANGVRSLLEGTSDRPPCALRSWFGILDALPTSIRSCRGPKDLGDLLVHDTEECWQFRWRSGIRYFRVYRPAHYPRREVVSWSNFTPVVTLAAAVYGVPSGTQPSRVGSSVRPHGYIIPRGAVAGYKIGWVPYS